MAVTEEMLDRARAARARRLIEAFTYRMAAHTTSDDPTKYRFSAEVEMWRAGPDRPASRRTWRTRAIADGAFFDAIEPRPMNWRPRFVRRRDDARSPTWRRSSTTSTPSPIAWSRSDRAFLRAYEASFEDEEVA
jgi:2-oxoisovalerate dehydrogenase E1 component alpha subunit